MPSLPAWHSQCSQSAGSQYSQQQTANKPHAVRHWHCGTVPSWNSRVPELPLNFPTVHATASTTPSQNIRLLLRRSQAEKGIEKQQEKDIHLRVQLVGERLKENAGRGNLLPIPSVIAMSQMTTTWQVEAHDPLIWQQKSCVDGQVRGTAPGWSRYGHSTQKY